MKKVFIGFLTIISLSAFAEDFCGTVSKVSTSYAGGYNQLGVYIGSIELKNVTPQELSILLAAKTSNIEVCVQGSLDTTKFASSRVIELK